MLCFGPSAGQGWPAKLEPKPKPELELEPASLSDPVHFGLNLEFESDVYLGWLSKRCDNNNNNGEATHVSDLQVQVRLPSNHNSNNDDDADDDVSNGNTNWAGREPWKSRCRPPTAATAFQNNGPYCQDLYRLGCVSPISGHRL